MALSKALQRQVNTAAKSISKKSTITAAEAIAELEGHLRKHIGGAGGMPPRVKGLLLGGMQSSVFDSSHGEITMQLNKESILGNGVQANLYSLYNNGWTVSKDAIVKTNYRGRTVVINLKTTRGFCSQPAWQFAQAAKADLESAHPECKVTIIG